MASDEKSYDEDSLERCYGAERCIRFEDLVKKNLDVRRKTRSLVTLLMTTTSCLMCIGVAFGLITFERFSMVMAIIGAPWGTAMAYYFKTTVKTEDV